jgi:hypothetical protein
VNHARRDLCGGCSAMGIPTAIDLVVDTFDLQNVLLLKIRRTILPRFLFVAIAKGQSQQE